MVATNKECQSLLDRPNPFQSQSELVSLVGLYLSLYGNAYIYKVRVSGRVKELWCYSSAVVSPVLNKDGLIEKYVYRDNGREFPIAKEDVIHLRSPMVNPEKPYLGESPLMLLANEAGLDIFLTNFTKSYFQNNAVPSALVITDGVYTPESVQAANDLKQKWKEDFGGANQGNVLVGFGVKEIKTLAPPLKDLDVDKLRYFSESRICGALGVPPQLAYLGVSQESSTYNNIKTIKQDYTDSTLVPLWTAVADKLTVGLGSEYNCEVAFDIRKVEALRSKYLEEMKQYGDLIYKYQTAYPNDMSRDAAVSALKQLTGLDQFIIDELLPVKRELNVTSEGVIV